MRPGKGAGTKRMDPPSESLKKRAGRPPIGVTTVRAGSGIPSSVNVWDRWHAALQYVLYGLLVFAAISALFDGPLSGEPPSWGYRGAVCALTLLFGGWHWVTVMKHPGWAQKQPLKVLAYFVVAVVLYCGLAYLHPAYMSLLFVLYFNLYSLWPTRWAIPGAVALSLVAWWSAYGLTLGWPGPMALIFFGVATTVSLILSLFIDSIISQSEERQRLVEELEATRGELAIAEREAGVLEERQRVAREIHDTLAQGFVSIVTQLEAAEKDLRPEQRGVRLQLDRARHTAREGLSESRRLVRALRPELLEGASLPEALSRLANRWSEESGKKAGTTVTGTPRPMPMSTEVTLLRAAQEALSNVRKHASADEVDLTLSYMDDLVVLDVQDDGVGFGLAAPDDGGGFGLRAMRERVEQFGGRLLLESTAGAGTTLVVELPSGQEARKESVAEADAP